jgi:predicted small lipoprotein YifL
MSLPFLFRGRTFVIAGLLALALSACGRRGAPEAPLTSAELAAQQQSTQTRQVQARQAQADDDDDEVRETIVPTPAPPRRRSRAYTVPKEPFILDPLL